MNGRIIHRDRGAVIEIDALDESAASLQNGSEVEVSIDARVSTQRIGTEPSKLDDLLDLITEDNLHDFVEWGPPVGNEFL